MTNPQDPYGSPSPYGQDPYGSQPEHGQNPYGQPPGSPYPQQDPYQAYPSPYQPYPQAGYYPAAPGNNNLSIASLVISLVGLLCSLGPVLGPLGAILGHVALGQHKRNPALPGRGMAVAGTIIGWVVTALWIVLITVVILSMTGAFGPEFQGTD